MLVRSRSLPAVRFLQQFADTHLYSWVERDTARDKRGIRMQITEFSGRLSQGIDVFD